MFRTHPALVVPTVTCSKCGHDCDGTAVFLGYVTACLACAPGVLEAGGFEPPPIDQQTEPPPDAPTWIARMFMGMGS